MQPHSVVVVVKSTIPGFIFLRPGGCVFLPQFGRLLLVTGHAVATGRIVFVKVFFLCAHDNSQTAAHSLMKFSAA